MMNDELVGFTVLPVYEYKSRIHTSTRRRVSQRYHVITLSRYHSYDSTYDYVST